jgi:Tol biopolymer transport system component
VTLVVLVSSACGAGEAEQRVEGTTACTADLSQAIGPKPELRGATWSPDGRRIAFSAWDGKQTRIYAVTVADCTVELLGPRANVIAGTADWSSANRLAFDGTAPGGTGDGIYTMDADGTHVRRITDGPDLFPEWSPDGTRIAFVRGGYAEPTDDDPTPAYANRNVWVVKSDGSGLRQVSEGRWHGSANWSPDGHRLVTDSDSRVVELGVDGSDRRVLLEGEYSEPGWSPDGELLVLAVGPGLGLAKQGQSPVEPLDTPGAFSPEWSPDGEWIAFTDGENEADVWLVRPDGTGLRQLTRVGR